MSDSLYLPAAGEWTCCLLAQAQGGGGMDGLLSSMMLPLLLTMVLMYFLLMRPEQRKRKDLEKQLSTLKKNDHVVTIGGIQGVVMSADPDSKTVVLRVDDTTGTKLRVLRSAIASIISEDARQETKAAS